MASNQVVVANVNVMLFEFDSFHLFSFFQNLAQEILCKGQDHWAGGAWGVEGVITQGSRAQRFRFTFRFRLDLDLDLLSEIYHIIY